VKRDGNVASPSRFWRRQYYTRISAPGGCKPGSCAFVEEPGRDAGHGWEKRPHRSRRQNGGCGALMRHSGQAKAWNSSLVVPAWLRRRPSKRAGHQSRHSARSGKLGLVSANLARRQVEQRYPSLPLGGLRAAAKKEAANGPAKETRMRLLCTWPHDGRALRQRLILDGRSTKARMARGRAWSGCWRDFNSEKKTPEETRAINSEAWRAVGWNGAEGNSDMGGMGMALEPERHCARLAGSNAERMNCCERPAGRQLHLRTASLVAWKPAGAPGTAFRRMARDSLGAIRNI